MKNLYIGLFIFLCFIFSNTLSSDNWQKIDEGLFSGEFEFSQKSELGDSKVTIIKEVGSFETNWNESNDNELFYHLPNVIGIRKRNK